MILGFQLSMPKVNTWNNKWSGEDKTHVLIREVSEDIGKKLDNGVFTHNFGDGWMAQIDVMELSEKLAEKFKLESNGFAGYDWMVGNLIKYGRIESEISK